MQVVGFYFCKSKYVPLEAFYAKRLILRAMSHPQSVLERKVYPRKLYVKRLILSAMPPPQSVSERKVYPRKLYVKRLILRAMSPLNLFRSEKPTLAKFLPLCSPSTLFSCIYKVAETPTLPRFYDAQTRNILSIYVRFDSSLPLHTVHQTTRHEFLPTLLQKSKVSQLAWPVI